MILVEAGPAGNDQPGCGTTDPHRMHGKAMPQD
jgi:hypothetical protein